MPIAEIIRAECPSHILPRQTLLDAHVARHISRVIDVDEGGVRHRPERRQRKSNKTGANQNGPECLSAFVQRQEREANGLELVGELVSFGAGRLLFFTHPKLTRVFANGLWAGQVFLVPLANAVRCRA